MSLIAASNEIHHILWSFIFVALASIVLVALGANIAGLMGASVAVIAWEFGLAFVAWRHVPLAVRRNISRAFLVPL
jgi:hypothetical protein